METEDFGGPENKYCILIGPNTRGVDQIDPYRTHITKMRCPLTLFCADVPGRQRAAAAAEDQLVFFEARIRRDPTIRIICGIFECFSPQGGSLPKWISDRSHIF